MPDENDDVRFKREYFQVKPDGTTAIPETPADVEILPAVLQDVEDLALARGESTDAPKRWWQILGPGLVTGAADDDPSGIGTYTIAGAQFGYALLWLVPLCIPLMISVQEMSGRLAATSSQGLAAVMKRRHSRTLLWACVSLLVVANTINIWADFNMVAASLAMLLGGAQWMWLTLATALTLALQILVPYRHYVKYLKWLCLVLLTYVITALLPSVHQNWRNIVYHLVVPHWDTSFAYVFTVVGVLGTTISPYLLFWQSGQTKEEQTASGHVDDPSPHLQNELQDIRSDTTVGMVASQIIAFFILICSAATLKGQTLESAQQAAHALLPLGRSAYLLFTLGIIGSGLLAIPTLAGSVAYAVSEAAGWREGLFRRFSRARRFYGVLAAVCLAGYLLNFVSVIQPVKALLYAAVLNGLVAPPLIAVLIHICNDPAIMGEQRNSRLSNIGGLATLVLMTVTAMYLLWAMVTGHAS